MRKLAIMLGGAALLAACETNPPPPPMAPAAAVDPTNPLFAPGFLTQATSGNLFEIQASQMALQMSTNPAVRNFANLMISDHMRMSQAMAAAAQSAGIVPPPPAMLPEQQAVMSQAERGRTELRRRLPRCADYRAPGGAGADAELRRQRRRPGAAHRRAAVDSDGPVAPCPGAAAESGADSSGPAADGSG